MTSEWYAPICDRNINKKQKTKMVVAKELIQLPCLQKWDKVRLKSPTMLVYTPPASSLLTYLFWFAFLYFNWSSLLIHFTRQKNKLGKWENFCPKKPKLRIESRVDTQPIWPKKRKNMQKKRVWVHEKIFLNFHSFKKRLKNSEKNLVKLLFKKRRGQAASSLFE